MDSYFNFRLAQSPHACSHSDATLQKGKCVDEEVKMETVVLIILKSGKNVRLHEHTALGGPFKWWAPKLIPNLPYGESTPVYCICRIFYLSTGRV